MVLNKFTSGIYFSSSYRGGNNIVIVSYSHGLKTLHLFLPGGEVKEGIEAEIRNGQILARQHRRDTASQ